MTVTLPQLAEKKRHGEPIVMVTAYDMPSARAAEAAGVDLVLAGDTAAMTLLGYPAPAPVPPAPAPAAMTALASPATAPVTSDEMLAMTKAARRGLRTPLLIGDLP